MFMKKSIIFILLAFPFLSPAQTVKVTDETIQIKGEAVEGFEVVLDGTLNDVQDQLGKYLKPIGKVKKGDDADVISLPVINGKTYTAPLYVVSRDKGTGSAWLGVKPNDFPSNLDAVKSEVRKLVYDFGVNFYREKIQSQIDESLRALQAVERQQQRLLNQQKDYNTRIGDNKNEKIQLEKSLENNKNQLQALTIKLEQNKKAQDSVAVAGEQIKKVIEMQKDKQRKVN
jgi:predicted RNase H-like nuclease (RuvC/YqgF family)